MLRLPCRTQCWTAVLTAAHNVVRAGTVQPQIAAFATCKAHRMWQSDWRSA